MKKHLLAFSLAAFIFIGITKAQIPNPGFETWTPDQANPAAMDPNAGNGPNQWECLNPFSSGLLGSSPISVFKDSTIVHSGKYACKVVSVVLSGPSYNYVKSFLPHDTVGIVVCGTIISNPSPGLKLGIPYPWRLTSINFYYQYFPAVNGKPDTGFCSVIVSHFSGGKRNTLGSALVGMNATGNTWTQGVATINYDSASGNPDTLTIFFSSSSYFKPLPGSVLYLDDASLTSLNDLSAPEAHIDVYPNPASSEVNFSISSLVGTEGYSIAMYDITGKKIDTYPVKNNFVAINTSNYSPGLYFYTLYNKSGLPMKMGKFCVVR